MDNSFDPKKLNFSRVVSAETMVSQILHLCMTKVYNLYD